MHLGESAGIQDYTERLTFISTVAMGQNPRTTYTIYIQGHWTVPNLSFDGLLKTLLFYLCKQ